MQFWWWTLWVLIVAQLIAIPFWPKLVGKLIKKKSSWKILNFGAAIVNFGVRAASYLTVLSALIIGLLSLSLRIGKQDMLAKIAPISAATSKADEDGLVDVRGQIHVHCYLSDDSKGTMEGLSQAAAKRGVRWIILTDHLKQLPPGDYPDYMNGILFIYGSERNAPQGSSQFWASLKDPEPALHLHGHLENFCRLSDAEKWEILNDKQWALRDYDREEKGGEKKWAALDGLELVNFHANAIISEPRILTSAFFDPDSMYDGLTEPLPRLFEHWQEVATKTGRPIPIFAAPDAHQNIKILGAQMDPYELILGLISTHIWIDKDKELNQESIFEAIKKGRTYIAFDYLADPTGFQFTAETKTGEKSFTGDTAEKTEYLVVRPPACLLAPSPYVKGRWLWNTSEITIKFYRDNQPNGEIDRYESFPTDMKPHIWMPEPGFWRVELWRKGKPWIISGQILIK